MVSQLQKAFTQASKSMAGRKPILFIIEDLIDSFNPIYYQGLNNLHQLFNNHHIDDKLTYISEQIKELEFMELNAPRNVTTLNSFVINLKKFFTVELEHMQYQQNNELDNNYHPKTKPETHDLKHDNNKILAFNYNAIRDDKLALVLKALIKLNAISPNTTLPQLRALFNGKEVTDPLKWLAGQGDLMVFIKEATSNGKLTFPYQQQWNIVIKCFVKPDGSKFNATSLKVSMPTNREAKFIKAANAF